MPSRHHRSHFRKILSTTLLVAALLCFTAFHFLSCNPDGNNKGWETWRSLWLLITHIPNIFVGPKTLMAYACLMTFSFLILVSPFLGEFWEKSRVAKWFAVSLSGLALAGFWGFVIFIEPVKLENLLTPGVFCLASATLLNFVGLLAYPQVSRDLRERTPMDSDSTAM